MAYCRDWFNYRRRLSSKVQVGALTLGGDAPVRLQSMANTSTMDTLASVDQCERIARAGGELLRLTAQGVREAENLEAIRRGLRERGVQAPLVADIHFNPKAAEAAATRVEKVRINPGNFAPEDQVRERFLPFLDLCRRHQTAIRIGVNHGSLSLRMMDRYGDTPEGMVASCMEYLYLCREQAFDNVVISVKASNSLIMVQTVRLLVDTMNREGMHYPLHLGVTEAGEGEDGRIKSALGIGCLLADGIGDTIRVSLSEDPEVEIPVARLLRDHIVGRGEAPLIEGKAFAGFDPFRFHRRHSRRTGDIGGTAVPVTVCDLSGPTAQPSAEVPSDYYYVGDRLDKVQAEGRFICRAEAWKEGVGNLFPLFEANALPAEGDVRLQGPCFLKSDYAQLKAGVLDRLPSCPGWVLMLESCHLNAPGEMRAAFHYLLEKGCDYPVVPVFDDRSESLEETQIYTAADAGFLLLDGFGDGLWLRSECRTPRECTQIMLAILQAARLRISHTEYVSCPSCGRTLFDLQRTIAKVKAGTAHLTGLKIGIMGCIVNGPGEMADADYGYVGAGRGKISLYRGRECVEKNLPEEEALEHLLALIRRDQADTGR